MLILLRNIRNLAPGRKPSCKTLPAGSASQYIWGFGCAVAFAKLKRCQTSVGHEKEGCDVDLALRLDVLAVCAAFAIVGAILLGAF